MHWQRKGKAGQVYVYFWKDGKQVPLKRTITSYLDGYEDHLIDREVEQKLAPQYEGDKRVTPENLLKKGSELGEHLEAYLAHLISRKKDANTVGWHRAMLTSYAIPFFLEGDTPLQDPAQWPGRSIKLLTWLKEHEVSYHNALRVNIALRGFYNYLIEEGQIRTGIDIKLREPVKDEDEDDEQTPLDYVPTPEEVVTFIKTKLAQATEEKVEHAKRQEKADLLAKKRKKKVRALTRAPDGTGPTYAALLALLGYFFSLRPQESFALRPKDFVGGKAVEPLECCRVMEEKGFFSKLAVNIHRQRTKKKKFRAPKAYSKGWVSCFNKEAAELLVTLLNDLGEDELIFNKSPDWLFEIWNRYGIRKDPKDEKADLTLKDLRRASLYYLGHHTELNDLANLMKHARHKRSETTMLYMRRPEEAATRTGKLSLYA